MDEKMPEPLGAAHAAPLHLASACCSFIAHVSRLHSQQMDEKIPEPLGAAHTDPMGAFPAIRKAIMDNFRRWGARMPPLPRRVACCVCSAWRRAFGVELARPVPPSWNPGLLEARLASLNIKLCRYQNMTAEEIQLDRYKKFRTL